MSTTITPYESALGVSGLNFTRIEPYDPETDPAQNMIDIGSSELKESFIMSIQEGEWVSGFSNYRPEFEVSLGNRVFKIGDTKAETIAKLDKGYSGSTDVLKIYYEEASFVITFSNDKIYHLYFSNNFY